MICGTYILSTVYKIPKYVFSLASKDIVPFKTKENWMVRPPQGRFPDETSSQSSSTRGESKCIDFRQLQVEVQWMVHYGAQILNYVTIGKSIHAHLTDFFNLILHSTPFRNPRSKASP